jgi:hypothetical protein
MGAIAVAPARALARDGRGGEATDTTHRWAGAGPAREATPPARPRSSPPPPPTRLRLTALLGAG